MMMSQIYQNAAVNVSADSGMDPRAGCFVKRDPADIIPLEIHSPQLSQSWTVLPGPFILFDWMRTTPSFSRAWIHRERQLARRVLHFTCKEVIWECCGTEGTSFASEMLPGGAPFKHGLFNSEHKYQIGRLQQGLIKGAEESYATWNDICEHLSDKSLTKPSDMPIVLSSLAKDFENWLPEDEYIAGLWRSTLPQSLSWYTRCFKPDDMSPIAPSWSWLSTGCAVRLAHRCHVEEKSCLAKILNIFTKPKYQNPYGSVKGSVLEVEGMLKHIRIFLTESSSVFHLSVRDYEGSNDHVRAIGPSWNEYWGNRCKLKLDSVSRGAILECFALFVTMHQWGDTDGSCREIECLLLQRCGKKKGTKFTRIGTLILYDLFGLKMRYRVREKSIDEDAWEGMQKRIQIAQAPILEAGEKKRKREEERDQRETVPEDATSDRTSDAPQPPPLQGFDALYQFDDEIGHTDNLERLTPQIITIV